MEEIKDDALLEFITDDDSYEYLERLFTCIEQDKHTEIEDSKFLTSNLS